ncbi:MAG: FAD-dependent thymidylate synthase, partial [Candidatus Cloacimonadota bacterium]|nr:FAD-dependent thymidylate synthase [Candidatus Cloacimonadota bacterium]
RQMTSKQTHINESQITPPEMVDRIELNNDNIGYVENWDFSKANMSAESRIYYISKIASVCYANDKAIGSISLYDRLACESAGLPSSSFEFVPVLIRASMVSALEVEPSNNWMKSSVKYGELVDSCAGIQYLLTNLRALMADVGDKADQFFNTEEECAIIAKHHKVFKAKIDIATRTQYIRHRVSWQELSRRYVSGKKSKLEFYISLKMKNVISTPPYSGQEKDTTEYLIDACVNHYNQAIKDGVKPEEARRILPQSLYTTIWSAWQPTQLQSFFDLRMDSHTQQEHQDLACAMHTLVSES